MKNKAKPGFDGPNVKEIFDTWISGYAKEDAEQIMSLYEKGCIYSEPCYPHQTYEDLEAWFEFDFSRSGPRPTWKYEIESIDVGGDLAVVVSRWTGFTDYGTKVEAVVRRLRSIDFLRAGANGWTIFRTLNDPEPCNPPDLKKKKRR